LGQQCELCEPAELPISEAELRASEPREEKKARLLLEGTPVTYVVCPLCGMNRVLEKHAKGRVRWDAVDPEKALVLQVRFGGGRDSGFYLDESKSLTMKAMYSNPDYRQIVEAILSQERRIAACAESHPLR
jgi:hypothetical protein